jgi:hypothetical protein
MHKEVFLDLVDELHGMGHSDSCFVTLEEQLAIYLYMCVTGLTVRHVGERFQRANETVSRYFRKMTVIFSSAQFFNKYVSLPSTAEPPSLFFAWNPKLYPFFKFALGALDGSHIHAAPPLYLRPLCRNRKGFYSQNCLFGCTFDLMFSYVLTGWEGSASDARIFQDALTKGLSIPEGWYYLADAGFPHCLQLLVPYRGIRYHLAEWGRANLRPQNPKELYNLRHAQARNVIERIFGVLKRRFRILLLAPEYRYDIQARIPASLSAIHNFIRLKNADEGFVGGDHDDSEDGTYMGYRFSGEDGPNPFEFMGDESSEEADRQRNGIAQEMWESYQQILEQRQSAMLNEEAVNHFLYDLDTNLDAPDGGTLGQIDGD